jgi:hypothetical protein
MGESEWTLKFLVANSNRGEEDNRGKVNVTPRGINSVFHLCGESNVNAMLSSSVLLSTYTYTQLEIYCPHIPPSQDG